MEYESKTPNAMILPLPTKLPVAEDAVRFISLEGYKKLFDDFQKGFPYKAPPSLPTNSRAITAGAAEKLEVHEVGGSTGEVVERAFTLSELRGRLPSEAGAESSTDPQAIALLQDTVTVESPSGSAPDLEGWSIALFDAGDDEVLAVGRCGAGSVVGGSPSPPTVPWVST